MAVLEEVTKDSIKKDLQNYIMDELVEGEVEVGDNLSDVLLRSRIGFDGSALQLAAHISSKYGIPYGMVVREKPSDYTIGSAAEFIFENRRAS